MKLDNVVVMRFQIVRWRRCFDTGAPVGRDGLPCPLWVLVEGEGMVGGANRTVHLQYGGPKLGSAGPDQVHLPEVGRISANVAATLAEVQAFREELLDAVGRRINLRIDKSDGVRIAGMSLGDRVVDV